MSLRLFPLLLGVLVVPCTATNATGCESDWCTSPNGDDGTDCVTWMDEPCTCSRGEARLEDYRGFYHEGNWYYVYTCCTGGDNVGRNCGYRDPTLTHPERRHGPGITVHAVIVLVVGALLLCFTLTTTIAWSCKYSKLARGVPTSAFCATPPNAIDVTSEPHACCSTPGYSGVSAATMDPRARLEPYMSRQEFEAAFAELTRKIHKELDCRPTDIVWFWIPVVLTWPIGGFISFIIAACSVKVAATAIHGQVIGPLCAKAGLAYSIIPPKPPDGYGSPANPGVVRFFLPAGAASVVGAQMGVPLQTVQPMPATPLPLASAVAVAIPPPQQMQVVVPAGVQTGQPFTIMTPSGQQMQVTCPPGAAAGSTIAVTVSV